MPHLLLSAFTALLAAGAWAHDMPSQLGKVDFPVSCSADAQREMTGGVLLLHHMMYVQAEGRFVAAAEADPSCAMAQWGIEMSHFHPLWPGGQSGAEFQAGRAAMERAKRLNPVTDREAAYLGAAAAFYGDPRPDLPEGAHYDNTRPELGDHPLSYPERLAAWAQAQQKVFAAYPDDLDARAFAALAMLTIAPGADDALAVQRKAGALLEELHEMAPLHPAGFHYTIHAYDSPELAPQAEPFARDYDKIAPDVPHALHMPSHIWVRLGRWPEAVEWNERSAQAALAQPMAGGVIATHYAHAIDYLVYALLQMGDTEAAEERVDDLLAVDKLQDDFGSAYALAAAPARVALERQDWAAAAALPPIPHNGLSWPKYPQALSIVWFAKGLGAARSGDLTAAAAAMKELTDLRMRMSGSGMDYWVTLSYAQFKTVEAWSAYASDRPDLAVTLMRQAADLEDSVPKAPVTPGHVLPARELLGDMLLALGRNAEAKTAYEAALTISPNRRRSLSGARMADRMLSRL